MALPSPVAAPTGQPSTFYIGSDASNKESDDVDLDVIQDLILQETQQLQEAIKDLKNTSREAIEVLKNTSDYKTFKKLVGT